MLSKAHSLEQQMGDKSDLQKVFHDRQQRASMLEKQLADKDQISKAQIEKQ